MALRMLPLLAVLAIGLAATTPAQTTHTVTQSGFGFSPKTVTIAPGDTVQWVWTSGFHTVTSGAPCTASGLFDMPLDSGHTTASFTFGSVGVFDYFCIPHCAFGMTGTVTVTTAVPAIPVWGVAALCLLALGAGALLLRRRAGRASA